MPLPEQDPISIDHETIFSGPYPIDQLAWFGAALLGILLLLTIRDFVFARKKWIVPFLFLFRSIACAGILLALAAPAETTRKSFETGHNSIGIYLDTSPSMNLRDPVDGKGHLARWAIAAEKAQKVPSKLETVDETQTRIQTALAMVSEAEKKGTMAKDSRHLLDIQFRHAQDVFTKYKSKLPYPGLADEIRELLKNAEGTSIDLHQVPEISNRIAVISRELARREESDNAPDSRTRLELAGDLLAHIENDVLASHSEDDLKILRYQFSEKVSPLTEQWKLKKDQSTSGTDLNTVLKQIAHQYRNQQIDAAFLITDAVHNQTDKAPLQIPPELIDFPLFLIPAGGDYQLNDLTLWQASAPKSMAKGDFLNIECLVGARGYTGKSTQLRLLEDGKELDSVQVIFDGDNQDQKIRLTTKVNSAGAHRFKIEIVPLPDELHTGNNQEFIDVTAHTGDLKVLLVDGWPRWETRYLSNLLARDKTIDHREILFAPTPPDPFPRVLSSTKKLDEFQIVVLGELGPAFLGDSELDTLEKYVNNGGSLIILAGEKSMPGAFRDTVLADLLPVKLSGIRPQVTTSLHLTPTPVGHRIAALNLESGREQNEAVWKLGASLLQSTNLSPFNLPKPSAQVLIEARPSKQDTAMKDSAIPFLVWHRYGAGRVFYFTSPTTYHLRYRFGDRYHYRFWGQFLRWSTVAEMQKGNSDIRISSNEKKYTESDSPIFQIEIHDTKGEPLTGAKIGINLEAPHQETTTYRCVEVAGESGIYEVTLPAQKHGEYRVKVIGEAVEKLIGEMLKTNAENSRVAESSFIVDAPINSEEGNRTCDWQTAQQLVNSTGGAMIPPESLKAAIEVFAQKKAKTIHENMTQKPLWNRWPLFFLILFFLAAEWTGRKFAGLI